MGESNPKSHMFLYIFMYIYIYVYTTSSYTVISPNMLVPGSPFRIVGTGLSAGLYLGKTREKVGIEPIELVVEPSNMVI